MKHKIKFIALVSIMAITGINAKNMNSKTENKQAMAQGEVIKNGKMVYSEITINARPEKVWEVFTDYGSYPTWNPFIKSLKGSPKVGSNIEVLLQPDGGKAMTFKPIVLQYQPNKEFRWVGKFGVSYIFDGEHTFKLKDNGDGTTTFIQYEHFRGILVPFMKKMLDGQTLNGFNQMNAQLKARVEQKIATN